MPIAKGPKGEPACKDCKHVNTRGEDAPGFWLCRLAQQRQIWSPLQGWLYEPSPHCARVRSDEMRCGEAGRWFDER